MAKKTVTRTYYLKHKTSGEERLVEAITPAHAVRHVSSEWEVSPATGRNAYDLGAKGVKIEQAAKEATAAEPAAEA